MDFATALRSHDPGDNVTLAETAAGFRANGLVGFDLAGQEAAFADPLCLHDGGGFMLEGSDSVFYENRPAVRVGDLCSLGQRSLSGEPTTLPTGRRQTF